jgi:hypothetical protein
MAGMPVPVSKWRIILLFGEGGELCRSHAHPWRHFTRPVIDHHIVGRAPRLLAASKNFEASIVQRIAQFTQENDQYIA